MLASRRSDVEGITPNGLLPADTVEYVNIGSWWTQ